jgi:hypothetical protein
MKRFRWQLCVVVFALALLALALPGAAAAAPVQGRLYDSDIVQGPVQPGFGIPGAFVLSFGKDLSEAQVDLPALNAVATVNGLSFAPRPSWDSIALKQKQPFVSQGATISEAQANISGANKGFSSSGSAQVTLNPSPALKASGKVGFVYDGMNKRTGFAIQNGSLNMALQPANVSVSGINTAQNALSVDSAKVEIPSTGASIALNGYQVKDGKADWKGLTIAQNPNSALALGNVGKLSNVQVTVAGPNAGNASVASANFAFGSGKAFQADGKVYIVNNPATKQSGVAFSDTNVALQVPGFGIAANGITSVKGGAMIDQVTLTAQPLNLQAEVTGVVVGGTSGVTFDEAKLTYGKGATQPGGFEMTVTKSPQGYLLTTQSVIPASTAKK